MPFSISSASDTSRSASARYASNSSPAQNPSQDFFDQLTQAQARSAPAPKPQPQAQASPPPAKKDDADGEDKTDGTDATSSTKDSDSSTDSDQNPVNPADQTDASQPQSVQDAHPETPAQITAKALSGETTVKQNQNVVTGTETESALPDATKSKPTASKKAAKSDASDTAQPKTASVETPVNPGVPANAHHNATPQNATTVQGDNPIAQDAAAIAGVATNTTAQTTTASASVPTVSASAANASVAASSITAVDGKTAKAVASADQTADANSQVTAEQSPGSPAAKSAAAKQALAATDNTDDDDAADVAGASDTAVASDAGSSSKSQISDATNAQMQTALMDMATATNSASASHTAHTVATAVVAPPLTPQQQFVAANQPTIVSSIHGQLLPSGGTMSIRLDPPELGALQVTVKMQDGSLSASFETSNDQATRLLTHSLGQLKHALETQGMAVGHLNVKQAAKSEFSSSDSSDDGDSRQRQSASGQNANQDQQRREILRRMWQRAAGNADPLDLVA